MPALDQCHYQVVRALKKEGWVVEEKPLKLVSNSRSRHVFIDIFAWRPSNGLTEQMLLAEVKCFPETTNENTELYTALGQYIVYRAILEELGRDVPLYLAVPENIFRDTFDPIAKKATRDNRVKLMIVNLDTETIVRWIE
jgi:hypothetical protein